MVRVNVFSWHIPAIGPERLHLLLAGFKRGWLLFEVVFDMTVDWHHRTPDRERRQVKMYEWAHKKILVRTRDGKPDGKPAPRRRAA